ncbi:MAG: hypothetical protein ACC662_02000 [Planctomycetota bacterium]
MMSSSADPDRTTALRERIVVVFLLLAILVLGTIYLHVLPSRVPAPEAFDLRNAMLSAEVGDCVAVESESRPGDLNCVTVVDPGVVLRPANEGPATVPAYGLVRRKPPYLLCGIRYPPGGKGCDEATGRQEAELYGLNDFGMPLSTHVELQSIRPRWTSEAAGRYRFVYEVQMMRYGYLNGPVLLRIADGAPVTGVIQRIDTPGRERIWRTVFRPASGCR